MTPLQRKVGYLNAFVQRGLTQCPVLNDTLWQVIREYGAWRFLRGRISAIRAAIVVDVRMFWRLNIRMEDPDDDRTWR